MNCELFDNKNVDIKFSSHDMFMEKNLHQVTLKAKIFFGSKNNKYK